MFNILNFGIIGGDKRQLHCAKAIAEDGYDVRIACFEKCEGFPELKAEKLESAVKKSDVLILPMPVTKNGQELNAEFSENNILLDDNFAGLCSGKPVFCGMKERLIKTSTLWNSDLVFDYGRRDEFAVENAVPTSEGAIEIAMREYDGTINGSRCLVTGYGRIGRVLSSMLMGLGAKVFVSARKKSDLAFIDASGMTPLVTSSLPPLKFDLIFNTVPFMVFDSHTLAKTAVGAIVIDLASLPGGVDFEAAQRLSIKAVRALSLPGKVAPKSAGKIIRNAVYNIIEEDTQ